MPDRRATWLDRWRRGWLALLLAGTLILSTGLPALALAADRPALSLKDSVKPAPVAAALQDKLAKSASVRFLVKLSQQADVRAAARRGRDLARDRGYRSPDLIRLNTRQEVVRTLRETAEAPRPASSRSWRR